MKFTSRSRWYVHGALPMATAAALIGVSATAHATNYNEGTVTTGTYTYPAGAGQGQNGTCVDTLCTSYSDPNDLSSDGSSPTNMGALTAGDNFITGAITTYGSTVLPNGTPVGPNHELTNQDQDYISFTVPNGYTLDHFLVSDGTSIMTAPPRDDRVFLGLASGDSVSVPYGPTADSAAGLLGWTLVSQSQLGTDILSAIGSANPSNFPSVPGATGFTGPLGAGAYTLWLYDGDSRANYNFDLVVAPAPEPAAWVMMTLGLGLTGAGLRRRRNKHAARITYA